jgi:hypothetical protein
MNNFSEDFNEFLLRCENIKNYHDTEVSETIIEFVNWCIRFRNGDHNLKENLNGMISNGLTNEEASLILAYTGSCSSWINSELREEGQVGECDCKKEFINRLNLALDKVKPFNNQIVYRMDSPSEDKNTVLNWFNSKISKVFKIPYFLSTAKEDYNNSEIVWRIQTLPINSFGKDISQLSNNKYEQEVLFRTGSFFKIKGIDNERKYINLLEIKNESEVNFNLVGCYCSNI